MDENFDFSKAKTVSEIPALKKLQNAAKRTVLNNENIEQQQTSNNENLLAFFKLFENDVIEALKQHANKPQDLNQVNAVLRALLSTMPD